MRELEYLQSQHFGLMLDGELKNFLASDHKNVLLIMTSNCIPISIILSFDPSTSKHAKILCQKLLVQLGNKPTLSLTSYFPGK